MIVMRKIKNIHFRFMQPIASIVLAGLTATASAANGPFDLSLSSNNLTTRDAKSLMLVANDSDIVNANTNMQVATPVAEFEPPLFTRRKTHQYLGLTTIALAGLTAITAPDECEGVNCSTRDVNGIHATFAKATIAMAVATIATGLYAHWDDFSLSDGWSDPDNLHVLLGVSGAALMAYAVNKSANSSVPVSHAGIAEAGAVLMVVAIKLTW